MGIKIPGKLLGNLLGERFMRFYVRKNFPPTGQKIIACGQHICPKEKTGQALFGLLGLNTVYELPAEQLFFPAVTFCGRCAILPKRNGKNFRRKKLNYCIRSRQIRTKNRLGCKPLYGSTESIMAVNSSSATACILRGAAKTQRRMRRPFLPKADRRRNGQNKCRKQRRSPKTAQRRPTK